MEFGTCSSPDFMWKVHTTAPVYEFTLDTL
uniref:Uncharacterized protein n=1 Tax=Arundo donax TaxID=35708 RepID=A0A0A9CMB3_ARUDO